MKLNFKTYGQGEPLIILHGLLGSLDNWSTLGKKFAENYTVFIVDQRNHGKSPHSSDFNYQLLVDDLHEFMEDNHIYSANILGHSMGGKTAMYFAMEHPDKVDKLIVADIAPMQYPMGHQQVFEALFSVDLNKVKTRNEVDQKLQDYIQDFGVRQFLMKGLTRNKERNFIWKFNVVEIWESYKEILKTFDLDLIFEGETLFIRGANSDYIKDEYLSIIEEHFPNNDLKTIENAGHWLHAEQPEIFFNIVIDFLQ